MPDETSRRRLLAAAAGGALLLGLPRKAEALRIEAADAATAQAFADACGGGGGAGDDHRARAVALLRSEAERRGVALTLADANELLAAVRCPLCGCAVGPVEAVPDAL